MAQECFVVQLGIEDILAVLDDSTGARSDFATVGCYYGVIPRWLSILSFDAYAWLGA